MGTRSTTKFIETYTDTKTGKKQATKLMAMYRQFDGYPSGHGQELADFLKDGKLVNGLGSGQPEKVFNGMGCLAAQAVKHFKDGAGGLYITTLKDRQEYNYEVIGDFDTRELTLVCRGSNGRVMFKGNPKEFEFFVESLKEE